MSQVYSSHSFVVLSLSYHNVGHKDLLSQRSMTYLNKKLGRKHLDLTFFKYQFWFVLQSLNFISELFLILQLQLFVKL